MKTFISIENMDYGSNENRFNSNRSYGNRGGEGNGGSDGGYRNFSASERSVIQIPGTHIGKIIGPAGRHINDMQRQYNVRIQINKMANSDGTKDAEISGNNINDIQDAIKAINEQIDAPFERRQGGGGGGRDGGYQPRSFGGQRDGGYRPRGDRGGYGDRQSGGFSRDN